MDNSTGQVNPIDPLYVNGHPFKSTHKLAQQLLLLLEEHERRKQQFIRAQDELNHHQQMLSDLLERSKLLEQQLGSIGSVVHGQRMATDRRARVKRHEAKDTLINDSA